MLTPDLFPTEDAFHFAMLADALPQLVWIADARGRALFLSRRWVAYTGHALNSDKKWEDLLHPDDCEQARDVWHACLAAGEPFNFEYRLRRIDGVYRWHLTRSIVLQDDHGGTRAWIGTCTDIQEQKERSRRDARKLAEAQARVHETVAAKSDFLTKMAHELRTPLQGIMGITDVLLETHLDDQQVKLAKVIKHSGSALINLLGDISDLSKLDVGRLALDQQPVDILALVRDQADALSFRAIGKHLSLMTYVDAKIPNRLVGDAERLSQVLLTLITHAIRATNTGLVAVRATLESRENGIARVRFSVEDTGMGMDADAQEHLFEPFTDCESAASNKFSGTGLGLTIAQRLVELMGGDIAVTSEAGRGTTFLFVVPLSIAGQSEKTKPPVCLEGKRVMVVDDDPAAARLFVHFLQDEGARTVHRALGTEALRQLRRVPHEFDVVIIDKRLPDIDGLDLAQQISKQPKLAHVRLVLVSAYAGDVDEETLREAGLAKFLHKPVRKADFIAAVSNRAGSQTRMPARAGESQRPGAVESTAPGPK